jgi:hypothetical protein
MGNEASSKQVGNGVGIAINGISINGGSEKMETKKEVTAEDLQSLRLKDLAIAKEKKKLEKKLQKEEELASKFSDDKIEQLIAEEKQRIEKEYVALQASIAQNESDKIAMELKVEGLQKQTATKLQELKEIKGLSGLHKNSPKQLASTPWKCAIPVSILGSIKELYPNRFIPVYNPAGVHVGMKSKPNGYVFVDFSDHVTFKVHKGFGDKRKTYPMTYGQGIKRKFRALLMELMPKAA